MHIYNVKCLEQWSIEVLLNATELNKLTIIVPWALKIKTFLGPEMEMSNGSAIWAQKSHDIQSLPLSMAWVMDLPPSKSLSPSAI